MVEYDRRQTEFVISEFKNLPSFMDYVRELRDAAQEEYSGQLLDLNTWEAAFHYYLESMNTWSGKISGYPGKAPKFLLSICDDIRDYVLKRPPHVEYPIVSPLSNDQTFEFNEKAFGELLGNLITQNTDPKDFWNILMGFNARRPLDFKIAGNAIRYFFDSLLELEGISEDRNYPQKMASCCLSDSEPIGVEAIRKKNYPKEGSTARETVDEAIRKICS